MELLELIMRLMDNYPLISIAFCLLIALGLIIYEIIKLLIDHPYSTDRTTISLARHTNKLVKEL